MAQLHRVMNMGDQPCFAEYNGRTFIWDPHPQKANGHYELQVKKGVVPIPRHIPVALRDTVYTPMEGNRGDELVKVSDGPNHYIHHVPEDFMRQLQTGSSRTAKDPFRNTSGLVFDQQQIDSLDMALEQRRADHKRMDAEETSKKQKLLELQAQIDAAQERAKALGLLDEANKDAGIKLPTNRTIR